MAKQTGMAWTTCTVDDDGGNGRAIKNDVTNLDLSMTSGVQDTTGLDKSAIERQLLLADFSLTLNGIWNSADDESHDVFKNVGTTSVGRTVALTISGQNLNNEVLFSAYDIVRATDGSMVWTAPALLQNGTLPAWS